jgi:hypothetical protein
MAEDTVNERAGYLREKGASAEYPFSQHWFRKRRRLGLPPKFVRVGRTVIYSRQDLDAFFRAHEVAPKEESR